VQLFDNFNGYTHRKGMIIDKKLLPFPITRKAIKRLKEKEVIFKELENRPNEIDKTNFETACISIFGKTLYNLFIKNYTEKMWGIKPSKLNADWAPKRLELGDESDDRVFKNTFQGLPSNGYSYWLEKMVEDIPIMFNCHVYYPEYYDLVISTQPINEMVDKNLGKLKYRSMTYSYGCSQITKNNWECNKYGTINLPQHPTFIRKCNFSVLHKQKVSFKNIIQFQEPCKHNSKNVPMYPISTNKNEEVFDKYLKEVCNINNVIPHGRLGLYKYLDMDKSIEISFDMVDLVESYSTMTPIDRYNKLKEIRNKY